MSIERLSKLLRAMQQDDNLHFVHVSKSLVLVYQKNYLTESTVATIQEFCKLANEEDYGILVNSEYSIVPPDYPKPLLNLNFSFG